MIDLIIGIVIFIVLFIAFCGIFYLFQYADDRKFKKQVFSSAAYKEKISQKDNENQKIMNWWTTSIINPASSVNNLLNLSKKF